MIINFQTYKQNAIADAVANGKPVPTLIEIVEQWMEWKRLLK
jgi:hypothetical protein